VIRRVALAMVVGVLAGSGGYALIYLFRWEWHRAIITALFFVAAEVGLGIAVLLRRLVRIEQQLDDLSHRPAASAPHEVDPAVLARIRDAAPPAPTPFAWLDPREQHNLSVFLPFLLGVGALASGLAWMVEQLARHTTTPALERRLAVRLAPLAMPAGGLLGIDLRLPADSRPRAVRRGRALPRIALVVLISLTVAGIDWLGDALQTRPDAHLEHVSTQIDVQLRGARSAAWPDQAAATLWGTCSHVLHGTVGAASFHDLGGGRFEVIVPTHIGTHAEERVRGCLEDAVVDRVQATVISVTPVPVD
jgi:hypothetical protein